ncbi:hypothetical protein B0I37DRAFT_371200 [Chaetomium sp. MPI-CAGE-AT-0009]|nr:hypothetical protein B0I37DRAFT_371200 [Chaetomium sp. MPI-CAGE-AT-0009]
MLPEVVRGRRRMQSSMTPTCEPPLEPLNFLPHNLLESTTQGSAGALVRCGWIPETARRTERTGHLAARWSPWSIQRENTRIPSWNRHLMHGLGLVRSSEDTKHCFGVLGMYVYTVQSKTVEDATELPSWTLEEDPRNRKLEATWKEKHPNNSGPARNREPGRGVAAVASPEIVPPLLWTTVFHPQDSDIRVAEYQGNIFL